MDSQDVTVVISILAKLTKEQNVNNLSVLDLLKKLYTFSKFRFRKYEDKSQIPLCCVPNIQDCKVPLSWKSEVDKFCVLGMLYGNPDEQGWGQAIYVLSNYCCNAELQDQKKFVNNDTSGIIADHILRTIESAGINCPKVAKLRNLCSIIKVKTMDCSKLMDFIMQTNIDPNEYGIEI